MIAHKDTYLLYRADVFQVLLKMVVCSADFLDLVAS